MGKEEFKFDTGLPLPAPTRTGRASEMMRRLAAMTPNVSFLENVEVPANTKASEKAEKLKELQGKTRNRLTSSIRRFKEKNPDHPHDFVVRLVNDKELGTGVRVYCTEQEAA